MNGQQRPAGGTTVRVPVGTPATEPQPKRHLWSRGTAPAPKPEPARPASDTRSDNRDDIHREDTPVHIIDTTQAPQQATAEPAAPHAAPVQQPRQPYHTAVPATDKQARGPRDGRPLQPKVSVPFVPLTGWGRKKEPVPFEKLSAADQQYYQALVTEKRLKADFEWLGELLNWYVKIKHVRLVLAVANQTGGASKTWTTNHLACELAETTRRPPAVVEGRRNSAVGWKTLGVEPSATISARDLYAVRHEIRSATDLADRTSYNALGVVLIKTDRTEPKGGSFEADEAAEVVALVASHYPVVMIDLGNVPTDAVNIGFCEKANVAVFVTIPSDESVDLLKDTVTDFVESDLGHLVRSCFYMVNKLPQGVEPESFRAQLEVPDDVRILGSHYDAVSDTTYSATSTSQVNRVIDLGRLELSTRVALRAALCEAFELAYRQQSGSDQHHPTPSS